MRFFSAVIAGFGIMCGFRLFDIITNPVQRAKLKNKLKKVKDTIFD